MNPPDQRRQDRAEQFQRLVQTGGDTDMGRLLRRFWHPIALAADLQPGTALPVRLLGEDLTLYRGASGKPFLVGGRCSHRRTLLHTGRVVGDAIHCIYHGWQFDGQGACAGRPAETGTGMPATRIAGYPVREYQGLVFAYPGDGQPPDFDLPRKPLLERPGTVVATGREQWDNNWFQQVENSLDATHVSFVHHAFTVGPFGAAVTEAVPQLEYEETPAGIRQTGRRAANNVRVSDWTFPNNNHILVPGLRDSDPWIHVFVWVTPNDDLNSTRFILYGLPPEADAAARDRFARYFDRYGNYDPAAHHDRLFRMRTWDDPDDTFVGLTAAQDYVAIRGQGRVAEREQETLGRSDLGIVTLRRLFWRELDALREGLPTKDWHALEHAAELPQQPGPRTEPATP